MLRTASPAKSPEGQEDAALRSAPGPAPADSSHLETVKQSELPRGWNMAPLGKFGTVRYGLGQPPEEDPEGLPIIRATNVKRGRISPKDLLRVTPSSLPAGRQPFLKAGDIIVVRSGAYTGDVAVVTPEWDGAVAGYDLIVSPSAQLDSSFCAFQLLTGRVQNYFRGQ